MPQLRVPSLQHLARNILPTAEQIEKKLIAVALNPPYFNYNILYGLAYDALAYGQPLDEIERGIRRRVANEEVRNIYLSISPLLHGHLSVIKPDFVNAVSRRHFNAGRDLLIPFDPPMIYGVGGQLHLPWFSFWRNDPLRDQKLSLFVTLMDEVLQEDPDLEFAKISILDFSAPIKGGDRVLNVIDANTVPRLLDGEKRELLERFAEAFITARFKLASMASRPAPRLDDHPEDRDAPHPDLFD